VVQGCFARGSDLVARYGGDEFVVLASAMDRKQAQQRAEQLREKIKTLGFASGGYATAPPVSLSIGVATATPLQKGTPDHLLNAADRALYQAKRRPDRDAEPVARTCTTRASSRGPAHPALSTSI
jgi:diguanylate cyclase (GGDEF)-like protein